MGQHKSDQDFLLSVKDLGDQSISVPLDVEDSTRAHRISMGIVDSDFIKVRPVGLPGPPIPVVKRLRGIRMAG
jgi:hypothetical protein